MSKIELLYRYDGGYFITDSISSKLIRTDYKVVKETPCGYWVRDVSLGYLEGFEKENQKNEKWVSKTGRKRLCYPTKKEALESLIYRRRRYIKILNAQLSKSHKIIGACERSIEREN